MSATVIEAITIAEPAAAGDARQTLHAAAAWRFPALDAPAAPAPVVPDPATWLRVLSMRIGTSIDQPVGLDPGPAPIEPEYDSFVRDDGVRLALDVPRALAAAIVNHRCGGAFDASGVALDSPSVERVRRDLATLACRAWPGSGIWSAGSPPEVPPCGAVLTAGEQRFDLAFAVTLPPPDRPVVGAEARAAWALALRSALAAMPYDLRVVLHDAGMGLAAACRLRPGDVIPIDTASAVLLRIGDHALARGTIAPDGRGAHVITIVGGPSRGLIRAPLEDQQ